MALYDSHSDEVLVRLMGAGDREAFAEIYRRYWDRLFYWGSKRLGDLGEAENQVQDVFVDLWRRRERLEIRGELNHYLAVALKYRIINYQARKYRADHYQRFAEG